MNWLALLLAIAVVESGCNDAAIGRKGERGRHQLTRAVWHRYTKKPFRYAHSRTWSDFIAKQHLQNLQKKLQTTNICVLANAYHLGESLAYKPCEYGKRVENLYLEYDKLLSATRK